MLSSLVFCLKNEIAIIYFLYRKVYLANAEFKRNINVAAPFIQM